VTHDVRDERGAGSDGTGPASRDPDARAHDDPPPDRAHLEPAEEWSEERRAAARPPRMQRNADERAGGEPDIR